MLLRGLVVKEEWAVEQRSHCFVAPPCRLRNWPEGRLCARCAQITEETCFHFCSILSPSPIHIHFCPFPILSLLFFFLSSDQPRRKHSRTAAVVGYCRFVLKQCRARSINLSPMPEAFVKCLTTRARSPFHPSSF